ncbi:hypothetical protein ACJIZ3_009132 [Penstemon smallii]|uniref:Hydroxyproline-rich glycoprotein family protein n=1 Tax=Penstemon smallii TaxID=265156 RepID=A0ABD3TBP1_9LAMI
MNSVETVNAAATAIVTAESRVQPSAVEKRRWGSCWSIYWCFGSYTKHSKRISHAALVSEPTAQGSVAPVVENLSHSASVVLPFIAPPSSPASFLQSDPPSSTQSPAGLLSLASLSETAPIYTIGPYAHETQLVSPPVFSTFTTEPSTASFTPPPEPVQMTTPSSPEVPFAQLLSSSLARSKRNSGTQLKYAWSQYEFQPYQYPGSPGGHIISPGSAFSTSGTSSPFPDKSQAPKYIGYEHFSSYKWGSRVGSGTLTPNGEVSRLGSGSLTPNGEISRLGSGTLTPNGELSRLGSGTLTPNGGEIPCSNILENQISEVASLANSDQELQNDDGLVHHRVSFELIGEDIPICVIREPLPSHENLRQEIPQGTNEKDLMKMDAHSSGEHVNGVHSMVSDKQRKGSFGSSKDFNFNNANGEVPDKSTIDCEWWTNDKVVQKELGPPNNWTFFPLLQSGVR